MCQLAVALSVDTGAGPAASAFFRPDAVSCRRWRAGASSACGSREEPETLRGHTLKIGERLRDAPAVKPAAAAASITVTVDSTFIRSCHDGERHLEVRVGNIETSDGSRQVFGAVGKASTDIAVLIRRGLETVGRTAATTLTAFTDGCPGLR